jgi:hypothetical protein
MRFLRPLAALLLACSSAPALAAQGAVLRPGNAVLDPSRIAAGVDTLDMYVGDAGEPDGSMIVETALARVGGRDAVVRRETLRVGSRVLNVDSMVLARESLHPVAVRSHGMFGRTSLDFAAGRVTGRLDGDDGDAPVDRVLAEPLFLAGSMDLVLAALPLAEGYAARLAVYDAEDGVTTARVTVQALEEVALAGGMVRAWRVKVAGGGAEGTYWMEEGAQSLVQFVAADRSMRIVRRGGATGRTAR